MPKDQPDWTSVISRPQTQLAGSPWNYAATTNTQSFTVAPDCSIVSVLFANPLFVTQLKITGDVSGATYLNVNPSLNNVSLYYPAIINSAVDTSVTITLVAGASGIAYVSSIPDPIAAVSMSTEPLPWQYANQPLKTIDFSNPGNGNTVTIVPNPPTGQAIYLHSISYLWTVATNTMFGIWQQIGGVELGADNATNGTVPRYMDFHGTKLTSAAGLQYKQTGSAAAGSNFCNGWLAYSIY